MAAQTSKTFDFVGGHPCLDFLNTDIYLQGEPVELLPDFRHFCLWLVEAGLLDTAVGKQSSQTWGGHAEGQGLLQQAWAFRQTLRNMVKQITQGQTISSDYVNEINRLLKVRYGHRQLTPHTEGFISNFVYTPQEPVHLLGPLAAIAADLLCTCDLSFIKHCHNPACTRYFYDQTKNHSRRWCSMDSCGNRFKVAAYYKRQRRAEKS